jgi:FkbM family methyltransferase
MTRRPIVRALAPGVPVVEIAPRFAARRHEVHDAGAQIGGMPLVVRSHAAPWHHLVSFLPGPHRPVAPDGVPVLGWLNRVDCTLLTGNAWLTCSDAGRVPVGEQLELLADVECVDLLSRHPDSCERVLLRQGEASTATSVRLDGFRSYCLIDDESVRLRSPSGSSPGPMPRWSRFYGKSEGDLSTRVRFFRFAHLESSRTMPWLESLEVVIAPGEQISQAVYVSGVYEPCTTDVLRRVLKPGDTFVDVGANIGLFTMLASRWVGPSGRVLAMEPSRRELARLQDHIDRNGLRQATALRIAAGRESGTAVLHVATGRHAGLNTLESRFMHADVDEAYTEVVPVAPLDEILPAHGIDRVDAMKVDVEGCEHDVIAGARRIMARDRPTLIIELAGAALAPGHAGRAAIETFLGSLDYRFAAIDGDTAALRPVTDLTASAENLVAARADVFAGLLRRHDVR